MSDATRDVVIRIKYETQKSKLESPIMSETEKALREHEAALGRVAKAEGEVMKAQAERARASKEFFTGKISQVPDDFQKYFKSLADAKAYAWQQFGPKGEQMLRDDPEYFRLSKRIDQPLEDAGKKTEEFGRKSNVAFSSSLEGVTNLTRGLALLGTNGTADAHKLLEKIVAIQGGIDVLRGGFQISRLGPDVAALTALVAGGTAAWMAYEHQVEKAKKQLAEMSEVARKHRDAENKLHQSLAEINARAEADKTNAAIRPEEREKRRVAEAESIKARMREQLPYASKLEEAAIRERGKRAAAEQREEAARKRESDAFWDPNLFVMPGQPGREAKEAERQKELADKAGKNYEELMKQRMGIGEQQAADQRRLLGIEQGRYTDRLSEIERNRDNEQALIRGKLDQMHARDASMSETAQAWRQYKDKLYDHNRGQYANAMQGSPSLAGPGGQFMDAAINTAISTTPQQIREGSLSYQAFGSNLKAESQISDLNQAFEKTFSDMREMIRKVDAANTELKSKLDAAHRN